MYSNHRKLIFSFVVIIIKLSHLAHVISHGNTSYLYFCFMANISFIILRVTNMIVIQNFVIFNKFADPSGRAV